MEILADDNDYKVEAKRGALVITRAGDGKVATVEGRGLAAWFRKNLAEYTPHRLVGVLLQTQDKPVDWV